MMLTGENGIITRADEAKNKTEISNLKEQAEIIRQGIVTGNRAEGKETTREEIIEGILEEMGGEAEGNLIKTEDGKNEIIVKEDGEIEVVEKGEGYTDAEYKEPAPESDFRWTTLEDGTVRIYEYLGTETSLHIPDTIDGKKVTVIKMDGRGGSSSNFVEGGRLSQNGIIFKSVKIPETVTEIGADAFEESKLENIKLPSKLTNIGPYAFYRNKLKKLEMPDTVTIVGYRAFGENEIETLKLSQNLTRIEEFAFSGNKIKSIVIPEGVTFIGDRAFMNNQATKIEIPSTVTTMEEGAFIQNNMEEIIYGRTPTGEGDKTVINSYAGRNAGNIVIPSSVRKIEHYAFISAGITNLEIEEGVEEIGMGAFSNAEENIESLIIPSSVKKVRMSSFWFKKIKNLEFKGETNINAYGTISADEIEKIIVPVGKKEYYQNLIDDEVIDCSNIGSIVEE